MKKIIPGVIAAIGTCGLLLGQSARTRPRFVAADIHPTSNYVATQQATIPIHGDRYEIRSATMLDLIANALGWDAWNITGGPNWLEMDRYDIIAKLPGEVSPDDRKLMLQALLEDRFKLVVQKDTRPVAGYVLTAGNHPALKRGGQEKSGCVPYASPVPTPMDSSQDTYGPNPIRFTIGPASTITYNCRNVTMDSFAQGLQSMVAAGLNPGPVLNSTGLQGAWNFDLHWTHQWIHLDRLPPGHVTIADALDQQLGLKLDERPVPAPVLVVVSVNRTPTANAANLAQVMPPIPTVMQFDVASVRPSSPGASRQNRRIDPARLTIERFPMRYLFNMALPMETIEKMPDWAETETFDIVAKAPPGVAPLNATNLGPPMLALLKDRFGLKYHTEQRPGPAYVIEAAKPKLKKADPARRTSCRRDTTPSGAQGILTRLTCQNVTMGQFIEWFSPRAVGLKYSTRGTTAISDATGLSGAWDFTLVYDAEQYFLQPGGPSDAAADPAGGYTIFEAMQRQLGLKLVTTSKPRPVIVIDHLEKKPNN